MKNSQLQEGLELEELGPFIFNPHHSPHSCEQVWTLFIVQAPGVRPWVSSTHVSFQGVHGALD